MSAVDSALLHQGDHVVELGGRQVGGDLEQDRTILVLSAPEVEQPAQDFLQRLLVLQMGQVADVGTADVDDEIVDVLVERPEQLQIVGRGRFVRSRRVLAQACADYLTALAVAEIAHGILHAPVVEAHPVDQRLVERQAEKPRPRIARLSLGRDGPHFGKTEAQRQQLVVYLGVLVESGGDADRVREFDAEHLALERRMPDRKTGPEQLPRSRNVMHDP